ncbi:MAG: hypothetical protein AVDCRST_MAG68-2365, partial [uncultured Gemmatimonadetes bacterium]
ALSEQYAQWRSFREPHPTPVPGGAGRTLRRAGVRRLRRHQRLRRRPRAEPRHGLGHDGRGHHPPRHPDRVSQGQRGDRRGRLRVRPGKGFGQPAAGKAGAPGYRAARRPRAGHQRRGGALRGQVGGSVADGAQGHHRAALPDRRARHRARPARADRGHRQGQHGEPAGGHRLREPGRPPHPGGGPGAGRQLPGREPASRAGGGGRHQRPDPRRGGADDGRLRPRDQHPHHHPARPGGHHRLGDGARRDGTAAHRGRGDFGEQHPGVGPPGGRADHPLVGGPHRPAGDLRHQRAGAAAGHGHGRGVRVRHGRERGGLGGRHAARPLPGAGHRERGGALPDGAAAGRRGQHPHPAGAAGPYPGRHGEPGHRGDGVGHRRGRQLRGRHFAGDAAATSVRAGGRGARGRRCGRPAGERAGDARPDGGVPVAGRHHRRPRVGRAAGVRVQHQLQPGGGAPRHLVGVRLAHQRGIAPVGAGRGLQRRLAAGGQQRRHQHLGGAHPRHRHHAGSPPHPHRGRGAVRRGVQRGKGLGARGGHRPVQRPPAVPGAALGRADPVLHPPHGYGARGHHPHPRPAQGHVVRVQPRHRGVHRLRHPHQRARHRGERAGRGPVARANDHGVPAPAAPHAARPEVRSRHGHPGERLAHPAAGCGALGHPAGPEPQRHQPWAQRHHVRGHEHPAQRHRLRRGGAQLRPRVLLPAPGLQPAGHQPRVLRPPAERVGPGDRAGAERGRVAGRGARQPGVLLRQQPAPGRRHAERVAHGRQRHAPAQLRLPGQRRAAPGLHLGDRRGGAVHRRDRHLQLRDDPAASRARPRDGYGDLGAGARGRPGGGDVRDPPVRADPVGDPAHGPDRRGPAAL